MIIAIDGPAASGKGTLGKRLAAHYGLRHLDTGLIYRAVAKALLDAGQPLDDTAHAIAAARTLDPAGFDEQALKSHTVGDAASVVSAIPEVRAALLAFQREFAAKPPGAVLDGRDIGTVIFPDADFKVYLEANPEERALRRLLERGARSEAGLVQTLREIQERDRLDSTRAAAPLQRPTDALVIDTDEVPPDRVVQRILEVYEARRAADE
jgi:cytidylate kinase